jgi:hypothetical protein
MHGSRSNAVPNHIAEQTFEKRFPTLILSARDIPRKQLPFNILLISAILRLDPERTYSEAEFNSELQRWILEFGQDLPLGHVELRRYLVDAGYVARDKAGSAYGVRPDSGPFTFDASLWDLDLVGLVTKTKAEREARKRAFVEAQES